MVPTILQEKHRFLTGNEMLASQLIPTTAKQAAICSAPVLRVGDSGLNKGTAAGNTMSTPCVGAIMLIAAMALEWR